jgi:GT2 family glycosyltransferase/exopolysaccharide biosynthesis predicted pyruvyltransferase EpsI
MSATCGSAAESVRESRAVSEDVFGAALAASRALLLDELGAGDDLTFVRGLGNLGDQLIWAGTRALLDSRAYREIGLGELASSEGDTVLLAGSGAWSRPYHEWAPRALAIAELRFSRVIVLPSSFDIGEDEVRRALARTNATVFARERESFAAITDLCRARQALDCAFFFDYSAYRTSGSGTLNAFRTDREATPGELVAPDNDDISVTAANLDAWLDAIARHAVVRTDRAHVLIAAAMMGKQVEFAPGSYHKLAAIAAGLTDAANVRQIEAPRAARGTGSATQAREQERRSERRAPAPRGDDQPAARITAVILSHNRPELVTLAVRSVTAAAVPAKVLVIDNNSDSETRELLAALPEEDTRVELRLSDENLGCAGGRRLGAELADTEMILFLDDDAELMPMALEHLLADLDAHPEAVGVTALVVGVSGKVFHFGGGMTVGPESVRFTLDGNGMPADDPSLQPTGPTGWVPGTAALIRAAVLHEVPLNLGMAAYYEDNDWCFRVEQAHPGRFRRCREAVAVHRRRYQSQTALPFVHGSWKAEMLFAQAQFLRTNGLLLDVDLRSLVPELRRADGTLDTARARLLLERVAAGGTDWATMALLNGELP